LCSVGVNSIDRIAPRVPIQVDPAVVANGIPIDEPTCSGVVVAVRQQEQGGTRYAVAGAGLVVGVIAPLTTEAYRVAVRAVLGKVRPGVLEQEAVGVVKRGVAS